MTHIKNILGRCCRHYKNSQFFLIESKMFQKLNYFEYIIQQNREKKLLFIDRLKQCVTATDRALCKKGSM